MLMLLHISTDLAMSVLAVVERLSANMVFVTRGNCKRQGAYRCHKEGYAQWSSLCQHVFEQQHNPVLLPACA